jgi:Asp-tRNA(Asn)/Glu-tRNA(Gln) amidotransferase A subunit family amidase
MSELNYLSAAEAARQFRSGRISCEALVSDCLERIEVRDGEVQAWVYCDPELALAQARAIDKSPPRGALAGVPIGVKDVIDTFDMPTQYNSPIYRNHQPQADAACVAMARHAGAVILGKTVTTEFASRTAGPTRNPHDLAHTPGGSSSGSAAAVADFMVPAAFGTQTGGSVIRPSAYCGVVGYKPSFGTISRAGLKPLAESLDTIGVIARTIEDCALLVHVVSGRALPDLGVKLSRPPRIGVCRTSRWKDASPATLELLDNAAARLSKAGAQVLPVALPEGFDELYEEQEVIMNFEAARALAHERFRHAAQLSDHLQSKLAQHWSMPRSYYDEALRHARNCRLEFTDIFSHIDVLLTPSALGEAPNGIETTGNSLFNRNWTLLNAPCVTIPAGVGPQGLPLGVQVVGRYYDDERVLLDAQWIRDALS